MMAPPIEVAPIAAPPLRCTSVQQRTPAGSGEGGQATILLLAVALAALLGALVLGAVAQGIGAQSDEQRAADLAALAGARAMHGAYGGLFEPRQIGGRPNRAHLERATYLERGRRVANS